MSDDTSDPARLERDLDQTRSRLGSHLSELQDRLSPGQVIDDLMRYFRGNDGADFGRSLLQNARSNPMPAALTGIGLAWLMMSKPPAGRSSPVASTPGREIGASSPGVHAPDGYGTAMMRVREAELGVARQPSETEHVYSARLDEARGRAVGLDRHANETTESFGQRIKDAIAAAQGVITATAHDLRDQAGAAASATGSAVSSFGASAQGAAQGAMRAAGGTLSQGGQAGGSLVGALADSPVLLSALGLAAGALLGALLPQSDQEEAALGGIAGQARDTATSLASQSLERGKQVAQAVMDRGRDSAQEQGLTTKSAGELVDAALSGDLAGSAKTVIQEVLKTGDETVRRDVASPSNEPGQPAQLGQPV